MSNTLSKINLSKIGWEGGRSTSIWIMSLNILFFFWRLPLILLLMTYAAQLTFMLPMWYVTMLYNSPCFRKTDTAS